MARKTRPDSPFGASLRALLVERGHTQTWLARRIGRRREQVNVWMTTEGLPPGDVVRDMADALGVPMDALAGAPYPDRSIEHASFTDQERAAMNDPRCRAVISLMAGFSEDQRRRLLKAATEIDDGQDTRRKEAVHRGPPR